MPERPPVAPALLLATLLGAVAFAYPFWLPEIGVGGEAAAHAADAPVLLAALLALSAAALADAVRRGGHPSAAARTVALLGVLVAINSTLRLLPALGGGSPLFLLIGLVGYVYGPTFGYLMGAMTLLVSALITGGVGPWLPYQMLGAGWMGLTAGWLPDLQRRPRAELAMLVAFGLAWGLFYGLLLNLWFWPFIDPALAEGGPAMSWTPGAGAAEGLRRYLLFYLLTSLAYDVLRSLATAALTLALARPLLTVLRRYRRRSSWRPLIVDEAA